MSNSIDGASFTCDDKAEKLSDCIRVDKSESHDDRRERKENSLEGRDDSQPTSSYIDNPKGHSTHSNQETVRTSITTNIGGVQILAGANTNPEHSDNRMELEDLVPKDNPSAIRAAASIIAQSQGQRIRLRRGFRRRKDPIWRATEIQANNGDWEGVLNHTHQCLLNPMLGYSQLNMKSVSVESYLLAQANAKEKSHLLEHYEAVNNLLSAYKDLYENKIDKVLDADYRKLTQNFRYSSYRVEQAQRRYVEFMKGKKFKISKGDQELLDKLVEMEKAGQLKATTKKLNSVATVFGAPAKALSIVEWISAFNQAQETKNWDVFWAKISASSVGMLISAIAVLGISASSLPVAFVVATLGVVASHYLDDEQLWLRIHDNVRSYFAP